MGKKRPISVKIVLPEDESHSPSGTADLSKIRHNGEVLEGHMEVNMNEQTEFHATVRFEGNSRTWIRPDNTGSDNAPISTGAHRFLSQCQEVSSRDCSSVIELGLERYCYKVPFRFVIPKNLVSASLNTMFLNLPPSYKGGLACHYQVNGHSFMQPFIGYTIQVVVTLKDANGQLATEGTCSSTRDVLLKPFNLAAPPLEISDLRGDYRLSSTTALKKSLWNKSIGYLEVSATEPYPLNMFIEAPRSTSIVPLKLTFTPHREHAHRVRPFEWDFEIETKILALTFYSTRLLEQEPSLQEVKTKPFLKVDSSLLNLETRIINDACWGHRRLSKQGTISSIQTPSWDTQFVIPINAPKDLLPTFLSTLASRRYALRVIVNVVGMHHSSIALQVPLQVNLEPSNSDDTSEDSNIASYEDITFSGLALTDNSTSPPPYRL